MERNNCMQISAVYFILFISCVFPGYQPYGYTHIGCFSVSAKNRQKQELNENTGDLCIGICLGKKYRYVGTQRKNCYCYYDIKLVNVPNGCVYDCPGRSEEKCGGPSAVSFYDLYYQSTRYSSSSTSTSKASDEIYVSVTSQGPLTRYFSSSIPTTLGWQSTSKATDETPVSVASQDIQRTKSNIASTSAMEGESDSFVYYVTVPLTVVVISVISLTSIVVIWRKKKRLKPDTDSVKEIDRNSRATNHVQNDHVDDEMSNADDVNATDGQYAEISLNRLNLSASSNNVYNTVNAISANEPENDYGDTSNKSGVFNDTTYSHLGDNRNKTGCKMIDTLDTYAHIPNVAAVTQYKGFTDETNDTYNRVQAPPEPNRESATYATDDHDYTYDHAIAGGRNIAHV